MERATRSVSIIWLFHNLLHFGGNIFVILEGKYESFLCVKGSWARIYYSIGKGFICPVSMDEYWLFPLRVITAQTLIYSVVRFLLVHESALAKGYFRSQAGILKRYFRGR